MGSQSQRTAPRRVLDELVRQRRERFLATAAENREKFVTSLREEALRALFRNDGAEEYSVGHYYEVRGDQGVSESGFGHTTDIGDGVAVHSENSVRRQKAVERVSQPKSRRPGEIRNPYRQSAAAEQRIARLTRLLTMPDFMVACPENLAQDWLAYRRPEGHRAVLIASQSRGYIFEKNQNRDPVIFKTLLPEVGLTILDGVVVKSETDVESFVVCDCICWGDISFGDSEASCRVFLLQGKFDEMGDLLQRRSDQNEVPLSMVEFVEATEDNLIQLYSETRMDILETETYPDSICFVHKEAPYCKGHNPCFLTWRDEHLSRWPVDTIQIASGTHIPSPRQQAKLYLRLSDGAFVTADRVVVGRMPVEDIAPALLKLKETLFVRLWKQHKIKEFLPVRVTFDSIDFTVADKMLEKTTIDDDAPDHRKGDGLEESPDGSSPPGGCSGELSGPPLVGSEMLLKNVRIETTPSQKACKMLDMLSRILHQCIMRNSLKRALINYREGLTNELPLALKQYSNADLLEVEAALQTVTLLPENKLLTFRKICHCAATGQGFNGFSTGVVQAADDDDTQDMSDTEFYGVN